MQNSVKYILYLEQLLLRRWLSWFYEFMDLTATTMGCGSDGRSGSVAVTALPLRSGSRSHL